MARLAGVAGPGYAPHVSKRDDRREQRSLVEEERAAWGTPAGGLRL
ncbi:MAG TPA: hypothetical protein VM695_08915 [Phycisphaerae bacterium]|nr:hypothetical protein [Phycisphaerae bacterium]